MSRCDGQHLVLCVKNTDDRWILTELNYLCDTCTKDNMIVFETDTNKLYCTPLKNSIYNYKFIPKRMDNEDECFVDIIDNVKKIYKYGDDDNVIEIDGCNKMYFCLTYFKDMFGECNRASKTESCTITKDALKEFCSRELTTHTDWTGTRVETKSQMSSVDELVEKMWKYLTEK